jgi:hypothetical protein
MIEFLITAVVIAVVIYVAMLLIGLLKLPSTIDTIARLVVGVIGLVYILQLFSKAIGNRL